MGGTGGRSMERAAAPAREDSTMQENNTMQSALYYPFTGPKGESFLKTALLLWDNVGFIVPDADFSPYGDTAETQEALEIIGRTYWCVPRTV